MGFKVLEIILALALNLINGAYSEHILFCNGSLFEPCHGDNQVCNVTSSQCGCIEGFVMNDDECESPDEVVAHVDHSSTTAIVTVFALVIIGAALVLVVRKYKLIEYVRQRINLRRNRDVMYEDVMIGNDDPPLSP